MKKIMFNDRYGLTKAVLDGRKTQTRRIAYDFRKHTSNEMPYPYYKVGEEVAVAQRYLDFRLPNGDVTKEFYKMCCENYMPLECLRSEAGAKNKMFVLADLMPHRIRITNIRVERLQNIIDEDCLKEGIMEWNPKDETEDIVIKDLHKYNKRNGHLPFEIPNCWNVYDTPRDAFADLIDKTCGCGTWDSNPYVFVYDFQLIK